MAATVRLQTLEGTWETVGVDRLRGVYPEDVSLTSGAAGSETCSFTLKRKPGQPYPDLGAFTPCEIEIDGIPSWGGEVWETPTQDGDDQRISVAGRGNQYVLDDDVYNATYVNRSLSDWVDIRTRPGADLTVYRPAPTFIAENGQLVLGWSVGSTRAVGDSVAAQFDAGEGNVISSIALGYVAIATDVNIAMDIYAHDSDAVPTAGTSLLSQSILSSERVFQNESFAPRRYISIRVRCTAVAGVNSVDCSQVIHWAVVTSQPAYAATRKGGTANSYTGNQGLSTLRASSVITDAVTKAAPALKTPAASGKYADDVLAGPYPVAQWRFNAQFGVGADSTAAIVDESGNNNGLAIGRSPLGGTDGTFVTGGMQTDPDDPNNKAMVFGGALCCATWSTALSELKDGQSYYLEAVFRPTALPQTEGGIIYVGDSGAGYGLLVAGAGGGSGSKLVILHGAVAWYDTGVTLVDDTWYHVAVWRTPETAKTAWVVNGVYGEVATAAYVAPGNTTAIYVGQAYQAAAPTTRFFTGEIDELAVAEAGPTQSGAGAAGHQVYERYKMAMDRRVGTVRRSPFNIDELSFPAQARTPREVGDAVNAYHDWLFQVDLDKNVVFKPKPSVPIYEAGAWTGADFADASANSGEEIYNKVRVEATAPDGTPSSLIRRAAVLPGALLGLAPQQLNNPSMDTVITDWTALGGTTVARYTSNYVSAPACLTCTGVGAVGEGTENATWAGGAPSFLAGTTYVMQLYVNATRQNAGPNEVTVKFGNVAGNDYSSLVQLVPMCAVAAAGEVWKWTDKYGGDSRVLVAWTPRVDTPAASVKVQAYMKAETSSSLLRLDSAYVYLSVGSLLDRRARTRTKILPVAAAMTPAGMRQVGNIFLVNHRSTPFKGTLTVSGTGGLREALTGREVHPAELLSRTGELIRFSNQIDPDTQGQGRDGRIASVTYTDENRQAAVSIDNQRGNFEALLARLAIVAGNVK
jgi:hypothetical protein